MNYIVKNVYGIQGESKHRTPEAACLAARKREGEGWVVEDSKGSRYTMYMDRAVMVSQGGHDEG